MCDSGHLPLHHNLAIPQTPRVSSLQPFPQAYHSGCHRYATPLFYQYSLSIRIAARFPHKRVHINDKHEAALVFPVHHMHIGVPLHILFLDIHKGTQNLQGAFVLRRLLGAHETLRGRHG